MEEILRLFPPAIKDELRIALFSRWTTLQEVRVRIDRPIELIFDHGTDWLKMVRPSEQDGNYLMNQISQFSLYRMEDELREGFITISGGHRIGLAGKVNTINGTVKAIRHIASYNIRIAKQKIGAGSLVIPYLYEKDYLNTLLVGPPQTGKTTLLRDIARLISSGWNGVEAKKTGIVDERSEIGGSINGVPQHDLGMRTDLMDACPKAEGMMMMIRSMSPEVLIVDEIGSTADVQALMEALHAGVKVICSIHGKSLSDLQRRPSLHPLFKQQTFQRFVFLQHGNQPGAITAIMDQKGENIFKKPRCRQDEMDRSPSTAMRNYLGRL